MLDTGVVLAVEVEDTDTDMDGDGGGWYSVYIHLDRWVSDRYYKYKIKIVDVLPDFITPRRLVFEPL